MFFHDLDPLSQEIIKPSNNLDVWVKCDLAVIGNGNHMCQTILKGLVD